MKQAILYGAGDLRMEDKPLDPGGLKDDEVYVETEVTALSTGTDLGNYLGHSTDVPGAPGYPRGVGYSNVGIVTKVGKAVSQLSVGQRVFSIKPHQSAYIAQSTDLLVPVPHGVEPEQASLAYLTQLGMAAMRQANYQAGESVAVVGLGVIGLGTIAVARAMGAITFGVANSQLRAHAALAVGAHRCYVLGQRDLPRDVDLVILTANPWAAYRASVDMARYGGRVSILGFPGRGEAAPDFNPFDPQWFYAKQLTLLGAGYSPHSETTPAEVRFNLRRNLEYIFALMASGSLNLETVISHQLPAARMGEAYELAKQHSKELVAAVFDWRNP